MPIFSLFFLALFSFSLCHGDEFVSKYSADISFLVADLKYNQEEGVKICEIQHGILSTFHGDLYTNNKGVIAENFVNAISQYTTRAWALGSISADPELKNEIRNSPIWSVKAHLGELLLDSEFVERSQWPVEDPSNLHHYHGLVYMSSGKYDELQLIQQLYPGVLIMDMPARAYWIDKYKMTELFNRNPLLTQYKPKWGVYPKEYSENLAKTISEELSGDLFVIKPRGAFLGKGIIIVSKEDLDATLQYILIRSEKLEKDPDKSYNHWTHDAHDSFIVEEFVHSDPVSIVHLEGKIYEPTIRVAALLTYHQNVVNSEFLGAYLLLPTHPLDEATTLNEKYKAYCKPPFYAKVDPETLSKVREQMMEAFILLYTEMLRGD